MASVTVSTEHTVSAAVGGGPLASGTHFVIVKWTPPGGGKAHLRYGDGTDWAYADNRHDRRVVVSDEYGGYIQGGGELQLEVGPIDVEGASCKLTTVALS